jgi:hypothetical protein
MTTQETKERIMYLACLKVTGAARMMVALEMKQLKRTLK